MKNKILTLLSLILLVTIPVLAQDSEAKKPTTLFFHVHEDFVYPSADYMSALEAFKNMAVEYKFDNPYTSVWLNNGSYLSVTPITGLAGVMDAFADFDKVPDDVVTSTMANFDGKYDKHRDYIARLHLNLSHNPRLDTEDQNYRSFRYYWFAQDKMPEVLEVVKEWKALYEAKEIKHGYEIWSPGFGHEGPVLIVIDWDVDAASYQIRKAVEATLLGDEAKALSEKTRKLFYKMDKVEGMILPEVSYMPAE
jgi:hypothetical protein